MHPLVRDLYKRFMIAGRDYPHAGGLPHVRERVKAALRAAAPADEPALLRAVHAGRWWVRELHGIAALKKYRTMRARYGDSSGGANAAALEAKGAALEAAARSAAAPPPPR